MVLRLQAQKIVISNGQLYWKDPVGIFLLCLVEEEIHKVIDEFHNCVCGVHYSWRATTHKILKARFYWPKLFGEVHTYVRVDYYKFIPLSNKCYIHSSLKKWLLCL